MLHIGGNYNSLTVRFPGCILELFYLQLLCLFAVYYSIDFSHRYNVKGNRCFDCWIADHGCRNCYIRLRCIAREVHIIFAGIISFSIWCTIPRTVRCIYRLSVSLIDLPQAGGSFSALIVGFQPRAAVDHRHFLLHGQRQLGSGHAACLHRHRGVGGGADDIVGTLTLGAVGPHIPVACFGEGDAGRTAGVGGDALGVAGKQRLAVVNGLRTADVILRPAGTHHVRLRCLTGDGFGLTRRGGIAVGGRIAVHEILEASVGVTPEAPVVEHRHVHHVAIFQDDPVRRGAGAARHDGVHMVHIIGQVLIVAPELRHVHTSGATGHGKRVSAYRQLAAVQVLLLQHFDEQVQHRRLLARVRTGVFAQTVVIQIKILHRYRDIGQRFAAGAGFVLPVIRQGKINRDLAVVFPLLRSGVLCHGMSPIRSKGADGQK